MPKTATITPSHSENRSDFSKVITEAKALAGLVYKGEAAKAKLVKLIEDFVAKQAYGERGKVRGEICKKIGIVESTFFEWKKQIEDEKEERQIIPAANYPAFTKQKRQIREAMLQAYRDKPDAKFEEILPKIIRESEQAKQKAREPWSPREVLVDALNKYLEEGTIEEFITILRNSPLQRKELCAALCGGPDGKSD